MGSNGGANGIEKEGAGLSKDCMLVGSLEERENRLGKTGRMETWASPAERWRGQMETSCQGMPGVDGNPVKKAEFNFSL